MCSSKKKDTVSGSTAASGIANPVSAGTIKQEQPVQTGRAKLTTSRQQFTPYTPPDSGLTQDNVQQADPWANGSLLTRTRRKKIYGG